MWRKFKKQGLVVVGINVADKPDRVKEFAKKYKLTYLQLLDTQHKVLTAYTNVGVIPRTVLLDRRQRIVMLQLGYVEKKFQQLIKAIETLL